MTAAYRRTEDGSVTNEHPRPSGAWTGHPRVQREKLGWASPQALVGFGILNHRRLAVHGKHDGTLALLDLLHEIVGRRRKAVRDWMPLVMSSIGSSGEAPFKVLSGSDPFVKPSATREVEHVCPKVKHLIR